MGAVCCCFMVSDRDEYDAAPRQAGVVHRDCFCIRCLAQPLVHAYTVLFQRGRIHGAPASVQEAAPLVPASSVEESPISDTYRAPPRPLPYDDPRCSGQPHQRIRLGSIYDKASSHFQEESAILGRNCNDADVETTCVKGKLNESGYGGGSKLCYPESSFNKLKEATEGFTYIFPSSEDEDVCPTCLEEYTSENPRIIMQCSHHFHLGCIYEWMERSEACPVCGKVMLFDETTGSHVPD